MRTFFIIFFFLISNSIFSQNSKESISIISDQYIQKLELKGEYGSKFMEIISDTGEILYDENVGKGAFNQQLKIRQLKVREILNDEQFERYLKLTIEIEPNIVYRY